MVLRRLGNKKKIAKEIQKYFPVHKIYIEPFFGAGGMFFNKPKAKYNIVNDLDSDVFNLFQVVMNQKKELEKAFYMMPIHYDLWEFYKKNIPKDKVERALRFLLISNFGYMGKPETLRWNNKNSKIRVLENIKNTFDLLFNVEFNNQGYDTFLKTISFNDNELKDVFTYNDPPYLDTTNNYTEGFTEELSFGLFESNESIGSKWAMSEFNHPFIISEAKRRNLNIIEVGEQNNMKNRRTEILVTNYSNSQLSLFE